MRAPKTLRRFAAMSAILAAAAAGNFPPRLAAAEAPNAEARTTTAAVATGVARGEQMFWQALTLLESSTDEEKERGRRMLRDAAHLEFPAAQFALGESWFLGLWGFEKSERRAAESFRLAAENGDSRAKARLGLCHASGAGVRRNAGLARRWLEAALADAETFRPPAPPAELIEQRRAAAAVDVALAMPGANAATAWEELCANAHYALGLLDRAARRHADALRHFETAANWGPQGRAGHFLAAGDAATAYALGRGAPRDLAKASALLERRSELMRHAQQAVARQMWINRKLDDFELEESEKQITAATDWSRVQEQMTVADSLFRDQPKDALRWCELAAESGEGWAMLKLAEWHSSPKPGQRAPEQAFAWFKRATEQGDDELAWGNLAACYRQGFGTPADLKAAAAITAPRESSNFICALVAAGRAPQGAWSFDSWRDLLVQCARRENLPVAMHHLAVQEMIEDSIKASRQAGQPVRVMKPGVMRLLTKAAEAGAGDADFEIGAFHEQTRNLRLAIEHYRRGVASGSSRCAFQLGVVEFNRPREERSLDAALKHYERALELSPLDADGHNNAGVVYEQMIEENWSSFFRDEWCAKMRAHYEEADRLGHALGTYNLGRMYLDGRYTKRDLRQAYLHFQTAAERGSAQANRVLGLMHQRGEGVPITPKEALHYFRLAGLEGDVESLRELCEAYLRGRGVPRDLERAQRWVELLVKTGHLSGRVAQAELLLAKKSYREALALYTALSQTFDSKVSRMACERLSQMYAQGQGTAVDRERAAELFERALAGWDPDALCRRGRVLITKGQPKAAVPLLERAAEGDSAEAFYLLGCLYFGGEGVERDDAAAWVLVRAAAMRGYTEAQLNLAIATMNGRAGAPEIEEAIALAEAAEMAGDEAAKRVREQLEARRAKPAGESNSMRSRAG